MTIKELQIENARLKAEVNNLRKNMEINTLQSTQELARLKALTVEMDKTINISQSGCRELKAEVNELADGLKLASEVGIKIADEVTRLKAEVERLTKANNSLNEWADFVRIAFEMNQNIPPSLSYVIQESIKTGKEPYFYPPTWSFNSETVQTIFEKLNKIQAAKEGEGQP